MIEPNRFMFFTLVLMRMSGMILFNPILGRRNVPAIVKAGIIMSLTIIVASFYDDAVQQPNTIIEYSVVLLKEFAVGYITGFIITLFLYVIISAGEIIDMQLGLSMSKIYDSQSNASISMSATLYNIVYMLFFFALNGHIALIHIILTSSEVVPYGEVVLNQIAYERIWDIFVECTILSVQFAFPILVAEIVCEVGVGILMKTIPQINVFVINIQAKVLIGILILLMMFVPMGEFIKDLIPKTVDAFREFMIFLQ
ncbi:MAG TPA: flagellar biosynthetic protein FliR [Candidatus Coprocola pullicola]|nr:flagellar biosynthetic protein FliR [Candidatus Coprocola pullicola]